MQVNNFWLKIYKHGQTWNAVSAYHSLNEAKGLKYAEMVKDAFGKGAERVSA
jgi:hypothetical protein